MKEHSLRRTTDGYFVGAIFPGRPNSRRLRRILISRIWAAATGFAKRWEQLVTESKGNIDVEIVKQMDDKYDAFEKKVGPNESESLRHGGALRGIPEWTGTVLSRRQCRQKLTREWRQMQFWAAMGHPCGDDCVAKAFLQDHHEYKWMKDILRDMPSRPWTTFSSGMR